MPNGLAMDLVKDYLIKSGYKATYKSIRDEDESSKKRMVSFCEEDAVQGSSRDERNNSILSSHHKDLLIS